MQTDGNLVVYQQGVGAIWDTSTAGTAADTAVMQGDGNFVLYAPGRALWSSGTYNNPNAGLDMQDDGNLVVYTPGRQPLWWSKR